MKTIKTVEELSEIFGGAPSTAAAGKIFSHLSSQAEEFIARTPFLLLSTRNEDGQVTISPKGDAAGFVYVADKNTLYIPERSGNRLIVSLLNILATESIGLIFLVPNTSETLRVSGQAEIVMDDELNQKLADRRDSPAILAVKVNVEESYFHCAKALLRSGLWKPDSWEDQNKVSFGRELVEKRLITEEIGAIVDKDIDDHYVQSIKEEGMID
ncbi:MAG: MSMEG_1061 family FMN-dependent PPOX-type flavoprotein [Chloroflexota bacterium]